MWYLNGREEKVLDYNKPIFAADAGQTIYILLPQIDTVGKNIGFNWFNIKQGDYNSTCFFKTAMEAVESYNYYKVYNGEIEIK